MLTRVSVKTCTSHRRNCGVWMLTRFCCCAILCMDLSSSGCTAQSSSTAPALAEKEASLAEQRVAHVVPSTVAVAASHADEPAASAAFACADATSPTPLPRGTLPAELWQAGWVSLFDGETLFGWHPTSHANWRVENGCIVVDSGEKGLLCTSVPFADYELYLEFLAEERTNSGVFLRTSARPTNPQVDCYELNIAPADNPYPTGSFVGRQKVEQQATKTGWHTFFVTANGGNFEVRLDDHVVLKYGDEQPLRSGLIGLQFNEGRVAFRHLRLRPLNVEPLFDGHSLTGWKTYPEQPVRVDVLDGVLLVRGGRGMVESTRQFANFLLQLECRTGARHTNSGVFFRCIPGELMNGYECQIHNGYHANDRSRPMDQGTGAIFRRQSARVVAADDQQWFGLTVVAAGPRLATWVNGLQVTDWQDDRPDAANPRQGRRLQAGTIMLQGHDPSTVVEFRKMRIVELPVQE